MKLLQNNFTKPLSLSLKSSASLAFIITVLHLLVASIILMSNSLPLSILLFLIILIFASYFYYYQRYVSLSLKKSIIKIQINADGDWSLVNSKNKIIKATIHPSSFTSSYLLILIFHSIEINKHTVLITKSMINNNDFRWLKVRLRTKPK